MWWTRARAAGREEYIMTGRILLGMAILGNCTVSVATFALHGWNAESAHAAARNTARFSSLWFIVAFAAPGMVRLVRSFPAPVTLIYSFVAAHMVHFVTIAVLLVTFERADVLHNTIRAAAVVLSGFSVVVGVVLTATPRASLLYTAVHRAMIYVIFLIFFLAYLNNPVTPLRLLVIPLGLALILRLSKRMMHCSPRMKPAG